VPDRTVTDIVDDLRHAAEYAHPPAIRGLLDRAAHEIEVLRTRLSEIGASAPQPAREGSVSSLKLGLLVAVLAAPIFGVNASAAPPAGTDPNSPTSKWVKTLKTSDGHDCCGIADCRPTKIVPSETGETGLKAWIGREQFGDGAPDDWVDVPAKALNPTQDENPTGTSWVCYHSYAEYGLKSIISKWHGDILCATPGSGT
jgi:hypothetical protein